jgi:hypothetical protein
MAHRKWQIYAMNARTYCTDTRNTIMSFGTAFVPNAVGTAPDLDTSSL